MARRGTWHWSFKWSSLFASLAFLTLANGAVLTADQTSESTDDHDVVIVDDVDVDEDIPFPSQEPTCKIDHNRNRFLMLVSTMDGKVSALNVGKAGVVEWSVDAGSTPLISSSISHLEIKKDGVATRLIPSLDGALFQFDGEVIEPLPFTADTLLSSTFRFQEDSMVVGGKGSETYGIDYHTGKVQYMCSSAGCKTFGDGSVADDDILVITRRTKTVRAVEMRTGTEKWNFSVGEHEVSYVRSAKNQRYDYIGHEDSTSQSPRKVVDPDGNVETCDDPEEASEEWFSWFTEGKSDLDLDDIELKVIVPNGLVAAVSKDNPSHILWQHKFDHSIANAWTLKEGQLSEVSLFDDTHNPALVQADTDTQTEADTNSFPAQPLLYVGSHDKQLYVQPSVLLVSELERVAANTEPGATITMPRVRWRPYLATAVTRTPAVTSIRNPLQISWDNTQPDEDEHGVAIWHEQYPYDGGFYLFPDYTPVTLHPDQAINTSIDYTRSLYNKYIGTIMLWSWWKEVVAASIVVSICIHLVVMKCIRKMSWRSANQITASQSQTRSQDQLTIESETATEKPNQQQPVATEYISRYYADFDQKECLGRGGFGVVFLAVNQMDDCEYAIKRITLNNSDRAKKKVMREVKALAKLDHTSIVRYYQSWFENPPCGWQEDIDKKCADMSSLTPTQGISDYTPGVKGSRPHPTGPQGDYISDEDTFAKMGIPNPLRSKPVLPFGSSEELSEEFTENESKRAGSTEGFVPRHELPSDDESGSFSLSTDSNPKRVAMEDSFDISFRDESKDSTVPFDAYNRNKMFTKLNDSLDIVFEDSGCGEKSSTADDAVVDIPVGISQSETSNKSLSQSEDQVKGQRLHRGHQEQATLDLHSRAKVVNRPGHLALGSVDSERSGVNPLPKLYLYIQMQLCQRESLKDWLNTNTLHRDRTEKLSIFQQIVEAVNYVHINGLMHRDLKPSNIFFSKDGVVKVGDFGLATALEEQFDTEAELYQHSPINHKYTNQVGTKLYMSPEQTAGKAYTHSVDIYALGMIFFELFYPFATQMERIKTLMEVRELKFPSRFLRELPDEFAFVKPLLSHDPSERPNTSELLASPLLMEAQEMMQVIARARTRTRTTSSSSGGSVSTAVS